MTRLTVSKAKAEFTDIVDRAARRKERTVLSRRGKGIAAVVPIEDLKLLEHLTQEEMDRQDIEDARKALAEGGKTISLREFMRDLAASVGGRSTSGRR
ncbi:MAG: type II toxin-antitoxin system prevent-host-death family antitoxin [Bryobacteraceae bacterium]|jgi:prevent-host-death family protein